MNRKGSLYVVFAVTLLVGAMLISPAPPASASATCQNFKNLDFNRNVDGAGLTCFQLSLAGDQNLKIRLTVVQGKFDLYFAAGNNRRLFKDTDQLNIDPVQSGEPQAQFVVKNRAAGKYVLAVVPVGSTSGRFTLDITTPEPASVAASPPNTQDQDRPPATVVTGELGMAPGSRTTYSIDIVCPGEVRASVFWAGPNTNTQLRLALVGPDGGWRASAVGNTLGSNLPSVAGLSHQAMFGDVRQGSRWWLVLENLTGGPVDGLLLEYSTPVSCSAETVELLALGMEPDTDRFGGDYASFELPQPRPELCQARCAEEAQCQAYTYGQPGLNGPAAYCWLKNSVSPPTPNSGVISGVMATVRQTEEILYQSDFGNGQAPGWKLENGWSVADRQLRGQGHRWARYTGGEWGDARLRFRLKIQEGSTIHLNYRVKNQGRYFIGFSENGLYLNKTPASGPPEQDLGGANIPHRAGVWHFVEIVGRGPRLQVLVDGIKELDYTDPNPLPSGTFAFETLDGAVAWVDDIVVIGPSPAGPAQRLYGNNFDAGAVANGWELAEGWSVTDGQLKGHGHQWAQYTGGDWNDFRLRFRLQIQAGTGIHLNYRVSDQGRYFIGFNQGGLYLSKEAPWSVFQENLAESDTPHRPDFWHYIDIIGQGDHLQVFVNGIRELDYIDPDPLRHGSFAFETLEGTVAIDDILVFAR